MASSDLVDWPADQPLRLSGSPASLRATGGAPGASDPLLATKPVSLVDCRDANGRLLLARSIGFARGQIRVRFEAATPPGHYTGRVDIAGAERPIEIDIIETIDISIRPSPLVLDAGRGRDQSAAVAFENRGNVPLTIDLAGEYPMGEEIAIFPERIERIDGDPIERLGELFARTITARAPRAMREAGTITLAMPDGAVSLDPGASRTIALKLALPADLSPTRRYRAFVPVYTGDLEIVAVTAAKTARPATRKKRGAST